MIKTTILIPIKNESQTLEELIGRVTNVMNSTHKGVWELLLIDDASTDNTAALITALKKKYKNIRVIFHKNSRGQTGCFKTGFNSARGKIIITLDGDLQVMPEDIPKFIEKMGQGYDLVNGIRENRQHPFWIKLASRIYNTLMLIFFNSPVFDAASNFTAIKTSLIKGVNLRGNDHRYIVPIAMQRGAKKIGEVVIIHKMRKSGKSKYKALPKYIKGFFEIFMAWTRLRLGIYKKRA